MKKKISLKDISKPSDQLVEITAEDLMPLPYPYNDPAYQPEMKQLTADQKVKVDASLDGVSALSLARPQSAEEEEEFVKKFLSGLKKLLNKKDNWTFLQPLMLSLENCAKCQNCSDYARSILRAATRRSTGRPTGRRYCAGSFAST